MGDYAKSEGRTNTPEQFDMFTRGTHIEGCCRRSRIFRVQAFAPVASVSRRKMFQLLEEESVAGRIYYKRLESREA